MYREGWCWKTGDVVDADGDGDEGPAARQPEELPDGPRQGAVDGGEEPLARHGELVVLPHEQHHRHVARLQPLLSLELKYHCLKMKYASLKIEKLIWLTSPYTSRSVPCRISYPMQL